MRLDQQPGIAGARYGRGAQMWIGQKVLAEIVRQDSDGVAGTNEAADNTCVVGHAACAALQSAGFEKFGLRRAVQSFRVAADKLLAVGTRHVSGLEEIKLRVHKFLNCEIAALGPAQTNSEIGFPARKVDSLVRGEELDRDARICGQQ